MYLVNNTILQGGKYKIVRFLSSGGFGNTYEGVHTLMDTRVAIKEFFPKMFCNRDENTSHVTVATQGNRELVDKLRKKFNEEAKAVFQMKHDNIVRVLDIFEENGTAYYVMEYIDGKSLNDITKERGALPESEAVGYILQVADALKYVHSLNRLHLDIKPGNIMIDKNGKAILIDFGASKHYDDESGENTSTLMGVNTKGYAPIEQSTQSFTSFSPATDIYALGATLYKLLTGIVPPDANLLLAEEETLQPLPSNISASTRNAIMESMALRRKDRPQTIDEFLSLLDSRIADNSEDEHTNSISKKYRVGGEHKSKQDITMQPTASKKKRRNKSSCEDSIVAVPNISSNRPQAMVTEDDEDTFFISEMQGAEKERKSKQKKTTEDKTSSLPTTRKATYKPKLNTFCVNGIFFNMVKVCGGTFTMGATVEQGSDAYNDEKPMHEVTLDGYWIGQTEVTQELWQAVMGNNPSFFKGSKKPVESVSCIVCRRFITKLNLITGKCFRLPTEAEWEFAARGGGKSRRQKYSGSDDISDVAWYEDNSGNNTHDVATKQPNELGIYDMSGNVWEWCSDCYDKYNSSSQTNPTGTSSGVERVLRGGSWFCSARNCRLSVRNGAMHDYSNDNLGFRLALSQ